MKQNPQKRSAPLDESYPNDRQVYPQAQSPAQKKVVPCVLMDLAPCELMDCPPKSRSTERFSLAVQKVCSACVRGRGLSLGHRKVDAKTKEAEQMPDVSVDYEFFGQPEDRAHDTLPVLIVRDRKSTRHRDSPSAVEGGGTPVSCIPLMADLDFMGLKRSVLKSHQEPSIVALCEGVKNG